MAQEFTIKSEQIESKINQLLPSQGGFGAGVDFSASTMVIPIVDLTETAEGSALRQDLQTALSHNQVTETEIVNTSTTIVNTTGYYRCFGTICLYGLTSGTTKSGQLQLSDGTTDKIILKYVTYNSQMYQCYDFDFIIKLDAGDSLVGVTDDANVQIRIATRQVADVNGNLTNP